MTVEQGILGLCLISVTVTLNVAYSYQSKGTIAAAACHRATHGCN